jgi:hypothetical protein
VGVLDMLKSMLKRVKLPNQTQHKLFSSRIARGVHLGAICLTFYDCTNKEARD